MHYDPEVPPSSLRYGGQNGVLSLVSNGGAWGVGCKPQLSTHPSTSVGPGTSFDGGGAHIVQGEEYYDNSFLRPSKIRFTAKSHHPGDGVYSP